ncbi:MAG: metallophosphoesterase [Candidatus Nomurabacteria bacterium]|nr:metallophosphoesterase [Candidatus Nomurabacteria bacterium]
MKIILFPFIFFALTVFTLIGLGHFVVYKSILIVFNITNIRFINTLRILLSIGAVSFITATLFTQLNYTKIGLIFYEGSAIWLGTLYFLFLASVIILIIFGINSFFGWSPMVFRIIGIFLYIIAIGFSVYGLINSYQIRTTKYTVFINNLPESWNNKNILMFSDSHFGNIRNLNFAKKLVKKINEQNPELVVIAGDYFDGPKTNSKEIAMSLKDIHTEKGIYFAPGNHEDYGNISEFNSSLSSAGVVILSNKIVDVDGLQIVGVDYTTGSNNTLLASTLKSLNIVKDIPKILIKHAPNNLPVVENSGFDLVLSGHVHNGQVWPGPLLARKIFKEFSYGLNYLNQMSVITSSGVGTWGPPQRIGTQSEIVLINLKKK